MEQFSLPKLPRAALRTQFSWQVPEHFNIATDTVDRHARTSPERVALLEPEGREVTYAQLKDLSDRLANALHAQGVRSGERVGIMMRQSLECALAHLAVQKLGAIALPLSVMFGEDALRYRLEYSGASLLMAERAALEPLAAAVPEGVKVLYEEGLLELAQAASPLFTPQPTWADDPAVLIYTSGTTGKSKGALLPQRVLLGHLPGFVLYSNFPTQPARYWSPADWAWIGGLFDVFYPALYYGHTLIAYRDKGFDPERAGWLLGRYAVTHTFLFPTALKLLRGLAAPKRLRLESVHSGGEPLGVELQEWSKEYLGVPVNEFYGQTEANLLVGSSYTTDPLRPGSMGLPYPGHEVVLLDETGERVPTGEVGEISLLTPDPVAFLGYWNDEAATRAKYSGAYLRTGDLAVMDEDGYIHFKARKDDLIKAAGYRISPFEVEEALLKHPSVALAAVIGKPDPERGQRVVAYVKLQAGVEAGERLSSHLQALVRQQVGHHAYPREVHFVDELPFTTTGKIQRFRLR